MIKYENEDRSRLAPLLRGVGDSMVLSYLQGYMGDAFTRSANEINAVVVISGKYSFWGGDSNSPEADYLTEHFFDVAWAESSIAIFAQDNPGWGAALLRQKKNNPVAAQRFHIAQKDYDFDIARLQAYRASLSRDFTLRPFDLAVYRAAMAEEWSSEFCEVFASGRDYLNRGFGFAAIYQGRLVSGSSTMTVYDKGAEIKVATREDFRRKGLALPCAAATVLECLNRKMRPHWDAANAISKKMALKLGYECIGEYTAIHLHR
ncbi:MAG: GNAT family N-acetyltransferase [Gracilibacteraceae bacterium]|jgi:hypothetical protein|nr:GNAT family N-acetyltransferase [Gracilibacteraceae bacterium]